MIDNFIFLLPPITACLLLSGMLSYFGNHILSRGIIFIDIALAQIAALGAMIGLLLGFAEGSGSVQIISLIFTIIIITFFALTKFEKQLIPQEAIIGIIYGLSLGIATLFAEAIPGGSNYITETITGNILWCTWDQVLSCFLLFASIGVIHIIYGKSFIKISDAKDGFPFSPKKVKSLEVIFYMTFGIIVVKAVPMAGIFLVFTLLIAPAAIATTFAQSWKYRFIWSWIIGIVGTIIGMLISYNANISNGPTIVCLFGISVFAFAYAKVIFSKSNRLKKVTP